MRSPHRRLLPSLWASAVLLSALLLVAVPTARAAPPPLGPLSLDRTLLSNLSAPSIAPGGTSTLSYEIRDPAWFGNLSHLVITFEVYALNGYPGNAVGPVPVANAPILETPTVSGRGVNVTITTFTRGTTFASSLLVVTSSATPAGTYAIRTALTFDHNASVYRFESRGWFSQSAWENATQGTGGAATVNATLLGVSGIVPETAVYVAPSGWSWAIGALVGIGLVVVGVGTWLYVRRGPGSSSGAGS